MLPANRQSRFPLGQLVSYIRSGILAGLISCTAANAQTSYTIRDLGVLPGWTGSQAAGINDRGDIVGSSVTPGNQPTGFLLRDGVMISVGQLPSGSSSRSTSSNSSGWVTGCADTKLPQPQAFLFRNHSLIDISSNTNNNVCSIFINDAGIVVGYFGHSADAGWIPQLWTEDPRKPGRFQATTLNPFPGDTQSFPNGANQSLQVVGYSANTATGARGVMWNNDVNHTPAILPPFPGDTQAVANAVNSLGVAAGYSWFGIFRRNPLIWSSDISHTPSALPLLPGETQGYASGINNAGQVIGYSGLDASFQGVTPVTWINGQIFTLQSMLDASGAGWQITNVAGINNLGLIVGTGNHNNVQRAFVLSPNF